MGGHYGNISYSKCLQRNLQSNSIHIISFVIFQKPYKQIEQLLKKMNLILKYLYHSYFNVFDTN